MRALQFTAYGGPEVLTGNNHHLEGINQLPPAARLRGLRVTCLKYGE